MPKRKILQLDESLPPLEDEPPNIYDATSDACIEGASIKDEILKDSPHHEFYTKKRKVVLDPLAPDYKDIFVNKGTVLAPDEVLHCIRPSALKIPLRLREDFDDPNALPDSDLLRAINYYASATELPIQSMDETALLAVGLLVEQWADEEIAAVKPSLFLGVDESVDLSKYAPPVSDDNDGEISSDDQADSAENTRDSGSDDEDDGSTRWSGEESDIMSIDMSDSDTASEIEDAREKMKKAKMLENKKASGGTSTEDSHSSSGDESSSSEESASSGDESSNDTQKPENTAPGQSDKVINGSGTKNLNDDEDSGSGSSNYASASDGIADKSDGSSDNSSDDSTNNSSDNSSDKSDDSSDENSS